MSWLQYIQNCKAANKPYSFKNFLFYNLLSIFIKSVFVIPRPNRIRLSVLMLRTHLSGDNIMATVY